MKTNLLSTALLLLAITATAQTWVTIPCPTTANLKKIDFINASFGYIVTDSDKIITTSDGGQSWQKHDLLLGNIAGCYFDAAFNTPLHGFFMVRNYSVNSHNYFATILETNDGGNSFNQVLYDSSYYFINSVDTNLVLVDMNRVNSDLYLTYGRGRWAQPYFSEKVMLKYDATMSPSQLKSSHGIRPNAVLGIITEMLQTEKSHLVIDGSNYYQFFKGYGDQNLYFSSDNGNNWVQIQSLNTILPNDVVFIAPTTFYIFHNGGIRYSTTSCQTLNTQTTPTTQNLNGGYFINTNNGWAVGDTGTLLQTTDAGANWSLYPNLVTTANLHSIASPNNATLFAAGDNGTILKYGNATGIEQTQEDLFFLYPNPATNQLTITSSGAEIEQINIYNTTGSLVMAVKLTTVNCQLSIENLATGVYIAEIKTKEGSVRKRWVKM